MKNSEEETGQSDWSDCGCVAFCCFAFENLTIRNDSGKNLYSASLLTGLSG